MISTPKEAKLTNASPPKEDKSTKQAKATVDQSKFSPKSESPVQKAPEELSLEEDQVPNNNEILIHYISTWELWDKNKIVVDNVFSYKVALDITRSNEEIITRSNEETKPQTIEQFQ